MTPPTGSELATAGSQIDAVLEITTAASDTTPF
jgi:hypothetical protein